jgi:hypothetical protein
MGELEVRVFNWIDVEVRKQQHDEHGRLRCVELSTWSGF